MSALMNCSIELYSSPLHQDSDQLDQNFSVGQDVKQYLELRIAYPARTFSSGSENEIKLKQMVADKLVHFYLFSFQLLLLLLTQIE